MLAFTQYTPTEIHFGKDTHLSVGKIIKKLGGKRVLIVYGSGSVVKTGLLDIVTSQLDKEDIAYLSFGGAKPNPLLSHAREGVKSAISFQTDFVLAVGGGSAIDTAKAIAHGVKNPDIDIWRYWKREFDVEKSLPIGVILTISAAGSETSNSAVLTNDETGEKRGLSTDFNRPRFAVMNPELTYTLPKYQIACGIADIMMHTLDRYFTQVEGNELTDELAEALLRVTIRNGRIAINSPTDYGAASELMWSGSLSHNGLTGLGRAGDFSVHQLGHELSGRFDAAHGASLTTVWGSWAAYCCSGNIGRFARYARNVWNVQEKDDEAAARLGIDKTVEYFASISMPTCFTELNIGVQTDEVIRELSYACTFSGKRLVGNFKPLNQADIEKIYRMANR
jgi:alcohol dehydrogenase YqhD (iron-dependent ADH family)